MPNYLELSEEAHEFMKNELQHWEGSDKCLLQKEMAWDKNPKKG